MKHLTKTLLLAALMSLINITAFAYDIAVENEDGVTIYYNYINEKTEFEVTSNTSNSSYRGNIKIPSMMNVNDCYILVTSIGDSAFYNCGDVTSVEIPNSVTIIGNFAFQGCSMLKSLSIPSSVARIGYGAFSGCTSLETVIIEEGNSTLTFGYVVPQCTGGTTPDTPDVPAQTGGNLIANGDFETWSRGTPTLWQSTSTASTSGVLSQSNDAHGGSYSVCLAGDTKVNQRMAYKEITLKAGTYAMKFYAKAATSDGGSVRPGYVPVIDGKVGSFVYGDYVYDLTTNDWTEVIHEFTLSYETTICLVILNSRHSGADVLIDDFELTLLSLDTSEDQCFYKCPLERIFIGRNITYKNHSPFMGCGITEVTIGDYVSRVGDSLFKGCINLQSVYLGDNMMAFNGTEFISAKKTVSLYTNRGTKTLLTLWNSNDKYLINIYDKTTGEELLPPTMNVSDITQTTVKVLLNGCKLDDGYTYSLNDEVLSDTIVAYQVLKPATQQYLTLTINKDDITHTVNGKYTTKSLEPRIEDFEVTASSISATGAYTEEDAKVVGHSIKINGYYYNNENYGAVDGNKIFMSGLNPGWGYNVEYTIEVDYGGEETATYTGSKYIYTESMKFQTAQPKVVSVGNVIVSTTVNLDENEENVGFEWRCTDWTDEFPSNTGTAYLYDGTIEGYIRNLNTDKLWKFRPYYLSNNGIYHYGDWMGVDPTNTSYFEPTVRTYAKINIDGNTALVKGYVLGGTDDIVVKGFKYWKTRTRAAVETRAASIPSDAITVEATGQQTMSANLTGLDYNSTYHYIAFATTSAGDTYYGEEQMFMTPLATSKYSTFYDSETAYILPSGLTASVVTGVKDGKLVYKVIAEGGKSNNILPKGVAVMLTSAKGQPSSYTLTPTESSTSYNGENLLKGSDKDTKTFADGGNCWFYKLSYGASGSDYRDVFGWYWGAANGGAFQIEGHKAWLAIPKTTKVGTRAFSVDGDATDIYSIDNEQLTNDNSAIYDLQGREVDMPQSNGIYIVNGKKVYVK